MASNLERDVQAIGREIFAKMEDRSPSVFQRNFWSGKLLDVCMKDEAFKLEMFRFVDVFPVLRGADEVSRHVREYFSREGQSFGFLGAALGLAGSGLGARIGAAVLEKNILSMARRFIAGERLEELRPVLMELRKGGLAFTVDLLGEATCSEAEAETYARRYMELLEGLSALTQSWPADERLDTDAYGPIPRVNVSIKVSALFSQMDAIAPERSLEALTARLLPILERARALGAFVNLDLEQYAHKDLTFALFRTLLDSPTLRDYPHAGLAMQAYLKDAVDDVRELARWAKKRKTPVTVRLVKGAYWDYETVIAKQRGWPSPVFENKQETDASFEACTEILLDAHKHVRLACASHNVRSIAKTLALANAQGLKPNAIELQMLYGMAEPIKYALKEMGYRVRDYLPVGELLPGMAYFVRRLLENTSNESFLRQRFAEGASVDALLAAPAPAPPPEKRAVPKATLQDPFHNAPPIDFTRPEHAEAMRRALHSVRKSFGAKLPAYVAGREQRSDNLSPSVNPARPSEVVAQACLSSEVDVRAALRTAREVFPSWRDTPVAERAEALRRAAQWMRERHFELAALEVLEAGKTWREADADVGEAIDFLEYYAREAVRLFAPRRMGHVPGEQNTYFYEPRGVGVVIAPWNFPLAILCGMTSAALVTGNSVIVKPAPETPAIAGKLMEALRAARVPDGVVQLLYGGAEIGEPLAASSEVDFVIFTGSKSVGLRLIELGARTPAGQRSVKRIIAEMGGKNAIIVDDDADLDEAVQGIVQSAFGFQGQKCSACSRLIVLDKVHDALLPRLMEAIQSLRIGPAEDPATRVGPVISARAQQRIQAYIAQGEKEARLLLRRDVPAEGFYVGPTLFGDVSPNAVIAQEEIFGPVLAVLRADSFDAALELANGTEFALTGGFFSRSPARIHEVRRSFRVGNLYINRGTTGALVERQPFGGAAMSGVGSKAGGPDYLLQFVEPRVVTENTLRRGFAPAED